MGTKGHKSLNKPIYLSIYDPLYPSSIKGLIYTKSNLTLINMYISTHAITKFWYIFIVTINSVRVWWQMDV